MLTNEQRDVIADAINAIGWSPSTEEGVEHIGKVRHGLWAILKAHPASAAPADLQQQLADAKDDALRLHSEKMALLEKYVYCAAPAEGREADERAALAAKLKELAEELDSHVHSGAKMTAAEHACMSVGGALHDLARAALATAPTMSEAAEKLDIAQLLFVARNKRAHDGLVQRLADMLEDYGRRISGVGHAPDYCITSIFNRTKPFTYQAFAQNLLTWVMERAQAERIDRANVEGEGK